MDHILADSINVTLDQHGRPIITTHVHFHGQVEKLQSHIYCISNYVNLVKSW